MASERPLSSIDEPSSITDPTIAKLAWLFSEHPVWADAMERIADGSVSAVYFSHRPGEPWHLIIESGAVHLRPGPIRNPDFVFRFSPQSVDKLAAVQGGIDAVAVELFDLILADEIGFRINASFWRLIRHGHLRLVLEAGPKVFAYGARHGVRTLGQLRAVAKSVSSSRQAAWERTDAS